MKVIVLIPDRTYPSFSGSKVRNRYLWLAMRDLGVEIRILGLDTTQPPSQEPLVPGMATEIFRHSREALPLRAIKSVIYSYHQWPYQPALADRVDRLLEEWKPDLVHAEELRMAAYLPSLRGKPRSSKESVAFHNVESELARRMGTSPYNFCRPLIDWIHGLNLRRFERSVAHSVDLCLAYSAVDRSKYQALYPEGHWRETRGGVQVLPGSAESPGPEKTALITGSLSYLPNEEGLEWFLSRVLPKVDPTIKITIAGSRAKPALVEKIRAAGLAFEDSPLELEPIYRRNAISLVPLLNGSGTRGRILESLGNGRAVVTTTIGAEGLGLRSGLKIADSPEKFAEAVNELCANSASSREMAMSGYSEVSQAFSWASVAKDLRKEWEQA